MIGFLILLNLIINIVWHWYSFSIAITISQAGRISAIRGNSLEKILGKIKRPAGLMSLIIGFIRIFIIIILMSNLAYARTIGVPAPSSSISNVEVGETYCKAGAGSSGAIDSSDNNHVCWLSQGGQPALFSRNTTFIAGQYVNLNDEFVSGYFPTTGPLTIREYLCSGSSPEWCTMGKSFAQIDGSKLTQGDTRQNISSVNPDFGGNNKSFNPNQDFTICLAFIDKDGVAWKTSGDNITCSDAKLMPDSPSTCRINAGDDMNVDLGVLEYTDISTEPLSGGKYSTKKTVSISCSSEASIVVSTEFKYQPLLISGRNLVSTTNKNIGLAVFMKNKLVDSSDKYMETYEPGSTPLEFEFQPVRFPESHERETGNLTASLIVVMTVQ